MWKLEKPLHGQTFRSCVAGSCDLSLGAEPLLLAVSSMRAPETEGRVRRGCLGVRGYRGEAGPQQHGLPRPPRLSVQTLSLCLSRVGLDVSHCCLVTVEWEKCCVSLPGSELPL